MHKLHQMPIFIKTKNEKKKKLKNYNKIATNWGVESIYLETI